jgi:HEPN domain-containing protein
MTEISELKSWITYAEEDHKAAKTLMDLKKPLLSAACFHSQQCAEKYLKALLILKDADFPKPHDLPTLNTLCAQTGILTGFDLQQLADLKKYAVQAASQRAKRREKHFKSPNPFAVLPAHFWG